MPTTAEPRLEDDASGEAWFQKGVTLLEGRKQEREFEEKLRRMSVMQEWQFWIGMLWVLILFFAANGTGSETARFIAAVSAVISFACAIDGAAAKRTQAMFEWIEYQKSKGRASGIDSVSPAE